MAQPQNTGEGRKTEPSRASIVWPCIQGLVCVATLACGGPEPGPRPAGPVAAQLYDAPGFTWRVVELPKNGLRLYIQRGTDADSDPRTLADSVLGAQADVLALLEEPLVAPGASRQDSAEQVYAAVFIVGSRADMQRLAGRPIAGFVQQGEPSAFFVWTAGYKAPLRHELAHLYTFQRWGQPPTGSAATWLVEGIGAWAGGSCQGHSPDALAAGLLASGRLPSVIELSERFRDLGEDIAMPSAGSLVGFIHEREGVAGLRARWQSGPRGLLPDSGFSAEWRSHLASVQPGSLDIARVMQEGC